MNIYSPTTVEFELTFEGSALAQQTMGARELGLAIVGVDTLFTRTNSLLNGPQASITIEARVPRSGSIELDFVMRVYETVMEFARDDLAPAQTILASVCGAHGLCNVIKRIRNRKVVRSEKNDDMVTIETADGDRIEMSPGVFLLWQDALARKASAEAVSPLRRNGIERAVFRSGNTAMVDIGSQDYEAFITSTDHEIISDATSRQVLTVIAPYLGSKTGVWRLHDGSKNSNYKIKDASFSAEVKGGAHSFKAGDLLECEVRAVQRAANGTIKKEFEIIEVIRRLDIDQIGKQLTLDERD